MTGLDYKRMRIKRYMTQEEVANILNISRFALSGYESNRADIPLTVSFKLNKLFSITETEFDEMNTRAYK